MYAIIIYNTGGDFMYNYPKIKYHYEFPNLPITDNDIQELYVKMTDILWEAESYILELNHQRMYLPDIFISDDVVTKTYGKYTYKAILKEIGKFHATFPYSCFNGMLEKLSTTIKRIQEESSTEILKELIECIESKFEHAELREERASIEKIISMLKNTKRTVQLLGAYYHQNNRIVLYINTIGDYFEKAPTGDLATKIKIGLEIVLAHEVFHAVQYHLMIDGNKTGKYLWTHPYCDKDYRDCVLEGLARWFEYSWCEDSQGNNPIYQWHKDQLDNELHTYYYPGWPYAAAKVFVRSGIPLRYEPMMVLETLLETVSRGDRYCWRKAYDALESIDYHNRKLP